MASITEANQMPSIFKEILLTRIRDAVQEEAEKIMKERISAIIADVLSDLSANAQMVQDMSRFEAKLILDVLYNGESVEQKEKKDGQH